MPNDPQISSNQIDDFEKSTGKQMAVFVISGGIAAAINIVARWVLSWVLVYEVAITIAYLIGMTTAFVLARAFVFAKGGGQWWEEFGRFAIVNAGSLAIVLGVSAGLARAVFPAIGFDWHADDLAHIIGVVSPVLFSFYAHKQFSFGGSKSADGHD